jgi:tetratricopeptide (TPR) repeat protein
MWQRIRRRPITVAGACTPALALLLAGACSSTAALPPSGPAPDLSARACYGPVIDQRATPESIVRVCGAAAKADRITVPEYAHANFHLGRAQGALRDYAPAAASLSRAVDLLEGRTDPVLPRALHELGRVEAALRNHVDAIAHLSQSLSVDPRNIEALFDLAETRLASGDVDGAEHDFEAVIALAASDPRNRKPIASRAGVRLGAIAMQTPTADASRRALSAYEAARSAQPANAEAWLGYGAAALRMAGFEASGDWNSRALTAYAEAARLAPESAEAHAGAARAMRGLGRIEDAIAQFARAAELAPSEPARRIELARAQRAALRLADAEQNYMVALGTEPDPRAWFEVSGVQLELGRLDAARASLENAQKLDPTFPGAFLGLGKLLFRQGPGHFPAARDQLREAERLTRLAGDAPMRAESLYYLSRIETESGAGDRKIAIESADTAAALDARNASYPEQACLARIRFLNRETAANRDAGAPCAFGASPPSALKLLLKGMFQLRAAHFAPGDDKKRRWEDAYAAFTDGLKLLDQRGDAQREALKNRLELGQGMSLYCVGFAGIGLQSIDKADKDARAFLDTYHVARCASY